MLEAYRRQTAHLLDVLNERLAEAAQVLVDTGAYPTMDALLSDYSSYLTRLFATVAGMRVSTLNPHAGQCCTSTV